MAARARGETRASANGANHHGGADEHHEHRDDDDDDHAGSTSRVRVTRWLTTLDERPGTIVTP